MAKEIKEPQTIYIKADETVLLYSNGKIVSKEKYNLPSAILTRYDSFIGTDEAVEAKIAELKLEEVKVKEIQKFELPKPPKKEETK